MGLPHPSSQLSNYDDDVNNHKPATLSPSCLKQQHHKDDLGGYVDVKDSIRPKQSKIKIKMKLSQEQINIIKRQADMKLTSWQFLFSSYFKSSPHTLEKLHKFVATLQPGESLILLQLLCAVPEEIHNIGTKPNLGKWWGELGGSDRAGAGSHQNSQGSRSAFL